MSTGTLIPSAGTGLLPVTSATPQTAAPTRPVPAAATISPAAAPNAAGLDCSNASDSFRQEVEAGGGSPGTSTHRTEARIQLHQGEPLTTIRQDDFSTDVDCANLVVAAAQFDPDMQRVARSVSCDTATLPAQGCNETMLGLAVFGGPHILGPGPQQSYPIGGGVNPADLL